MDGRDLRIVTPVPLLCEECLTESDPEALSWRIYLAPDPDDPAAAPMLGAYCPDCAEREFGAVRRGHRARVE